MQTGPYLVMFVNAWVHLLLRRFQRAEGRSPRLRSVAGWCLVTWLSATPVLGSFARRLVVLPGRSPLWAYVLNIVLGASLDELVRRRVRGRRSAGPADHP